MSHPSPDQVEPTELAGAAEAETASIYAWALDHDDADEFPTRRLTSRRITALGIAASLVVIAVSSVVALLVVRQHERQETSPSHAVETVARPAPPVTVTAPPPVTVTVQAAPAPTPPPSLTPQPTRNADSEASFV
jgi:hypothetical protein